MGAQLQALLIQALFPPLVGIIAGCALLLLWWYNRHIKYLPFFSISLFCFAIGFALSQILLERMTVPNALASNILFFMSTGSMVHGALLRKGLKLNVTLHLCLMVVDLIGRMIILYFDYSSLVYVVYINAMLAMPLAVGAYRLVTVNDRDIQSASVAFAFGFIATCLIAVTPIAVFLGGKITAENYFSSYYFFMLSILTVIGTSFLLLSFSFTMATDLLRTARSRDEKIADTIHDLRQPLHALRLKMHTLMEQSEKGKEGFEDVKQTFGYLETLISKELEGEDASEVTFREEEGARLTADTILLSVHEMFLPEAEEKGLILSYHPSEHELNIDELTLMRIASNLVSNAIKYTPSGAVEFGLNALDDQIYLEVSDTGLGMSRDEFSMALQRNVRLSAGTTQAEGHGFGLAIIKELAEEHGLKLALRSREDGTGVVVGFG